MRNYNKIQKIKKSIPHRQIGDRVYFIINKCKDLENAISKVDALIRNIPQLQNEFDKIRIYIEETESLPKKTKNEYDMYVAQCKAAAKQIFMLIDKIEKTKIKDNDKSEYDLDFPPDET